MLTLKNNIKRKHKSGLVFYLLFSLTIFITGCEKENDKCCSCLEESDTIDYYELTQVEEREDWKELSWAEKVELLQIPNSVLSEMCTQGLVETYFNYPLLSFVFAFSNVKDGLEQTYEEFNGMRELVSRTDGVSKILEKYIKLDPLAYERDWSSLEQGRFSANIRLVEVTMAFDKIRLQYTSEQRRELLAATLTKYEAKSSDELYGGPSLIVTLFLMANILELEHYPPFDQFMEEKNYIKAFIDGNLNVLQFVSEGEQIKSFVKQFLMTE